MNNWKYQTRDIYTSTIDVREIRPQYLGIEAITNSNGRSFHPHEPIIYGKMIGTFDSTTRDIPRNSTYGVDTFDVDEANKQPIFFINREKKKRVFYRERGA